MDEIRSVFCALPPALRARGLLLIGFMTIGALLELIGLASIAPFLAFVGSAENVDKYAALGWLYEAFGKPNRLIFACYLALLTFLAISLSTGFRILLLYLINAYVQGIAVFLSRTLFEGYLRAEYVFFLTRNSADITNTILTHVTNTVAHVLHPTLIIFSNLIVISLLFGGLVLIDAKASLVIALFVFGIYGLLYLSSRTVMRQMGAAAACEETRKHRISSEALGGIKIVKSRGLEPFYVGRFLRSALTYARAQSVSQSIAPSARYLVESLGIGGVLLFSVYVLQDSENAGTALSIIGVYVMAGNRLLPSVQQIFQSFSQIRYGMPALQTVLADISLKLPVAAPADDTGPDVIESIELREICYAYPGCDNQILKGVSAKLPTKKIIGIVGSSGAGKTTLIDILLGLLRPQGGSVVINGHDVDLTCFSRWKQVVGYVPQETFLVDGSIAENIAYGIDPQSIDHSRLRQAAISAGMHELILSLEKGFDTEVGERGVRLSGGQRQRIAIARALYPAPQVLIFDEATSALDMATEQEVVEAVLSLSGQVTVIMITHRLQSIRRADLILHIEGGELAGRGTFEELCERSEKFRLQT